MSIRTLLNLRPGAVAAWATLVLTLAGCGAQGPVAGGAEARLFARGLDEIADVYIEPIALRRIALSAITRLTRLDADLAVSEGGGSGVLSLGYGGHGIGAYATPEDMNGREWGAILATLIAAARDASPRLAALSKDAIDEAVFDGMTAPLDRFSHYSAPKLARAQRAARDGFGGIGVTLEAMSDFFRVTAVMPHGPADRAGIRPEDQIVAIDGVATTGRSYEEVARQLSGPVGSAVALSVLHPGAAQPGDLRLNRTLVTVPTVSVSRDGDIAVFHIAGFNRSTAQRIADGLAQLQQPPAARLAGIVIDLRGSPGGLLDQAVSLADIFIPDGPIVSTVGRHPASHQYFAASGTGTALSTPLAVLINGSSASAAEILAAALQDVGRAVVIGTSSYGKGTVQTVLPLPNDGELILTWARLITPSGYFLQTHGVVPTLCTSGLGDDERALDLGLQSIAAGSAARPRAGLDEAAWRELRHACPPRRTSPAIDLKLAERILADAKLYGAALRALATTHPGGSAPAVGRNEPPAPPVPALTGLNHALSSGTH